MTTKDANAGVIIKIITIVLIIAVALQIIVGYYNKVLDEKDRLEAKQIVNAISLVLAKYEGSNLTYKNGRIFWTKKNAEIIKAYKLGITVGTSETTFSPNRLITREQLATMVLRTLAAIGVDVDNIDLDAISKFDDDNEMHDWGRASIYFMAKEGIIKGVGNNIFNPLGNAKIEEAIAISLRCVELLKIFSCIN